MIVAQAGRPFSATVDDVPAGADLGVRVLDADGGVVIARTTAGVAPVVSGGDVYAVELTAPAEVGDYTVAWDVGGTDPLDVATEELRVLAGLVPVVELGEVFVDPDDLLGRAVAYERLVVGRAPAATLRSDDLDGLDLPDELVAEVVDLGGRLLASGAASSDGSTATAELPADVTARPIVLVVVWHDDAGTFTATSVVDVVGGALFTLADARHDGRIPDARATDAELLRARGEAERDLEDACGVALVRRYNRERLRADESGRVRIRAYRDVVVRELVVDGAPSLTLGDVHVTASGLLAPTDTAADGWRLVPGGEVVVGYEHGYTIPPARARLAALKLTRARLMLGPADERALAVPVEGGGSIPLATPGVRGRSFGIPDVDAFVQDYRVRRPVLA